MYCPNCGARNDRDATSCVNCGVELQPVGAPPNQTSGPPEGSGATPTPPPPRPGTGPDEPTQEAAPDRPLLQPGSQGGGFSDPSTPPPAGDEGRVFAPPASGGTGSSGYGSSGSTGSGGGYAGAMGQQVPNRLVPAIVYTVICVILALFSFGFTGLGVITGIIAIIFAAQVNGKVSQGDIAGAQQASKTARILNLVTLGIIAIGVLIAIVFVIIFVVALSSGA